MTRLLPPALLCGALAAACSSTRASVPVTEAEVTAAPERTTAAAPAAPGYVPAGDPYTLVLMRSGDPLRVPSGEDLATLTVDHRAYMELMTDEGYVLAAGPVVPPRTDAALRAMFFVDADDPAAAYERTCADPAVEAGLFDMEAVGFVTTSNLRALAAMERAGRIDRGGNVAMRPYVAVVAPTSAAMTAVLAQMGDAVLFHGHCTSGSLEGSTVAFLDCNTIDEARQLMAAVRGGETFDYHAWVAPTGVAKMN